MQPPKPPPPPRKQMAGSGSTATPVVPPPLPKTRSGIGPWICLGVSAAVFGIVAVAVVWQLASRQFSIANTAESPASQTVPGSNAEPSFPKSVKVDHHELPMVASDTATPHNNQPDPALGASADPESDSSLPGGSALTNAVPPKASIPTNSTSGQSPPALAESATTNDSDGPAFADLRRRNFELQLPGRGITRESGNVVLASVPVPQGELLQLAVSGGAGIRLVRASDAAEEDRTWTVMKKAQLAFGGQEDVTLGRFEHREGDLRFQWDPGAPAWAKPGSLQFCKLVVTVGKQSRPCTLWKPIVVNPTRLTPQSATTAELPLPGEFIDQPNAFQVHFQFAGTAATDNPSAVVTLDETAKILLGESEENGVEVELKITTGDSRSSLQIRLFAMAPVAGKDGDIRYVRQEVTPAIVQSHLRLGRIKDLKKRETEIERLGKQVASLQSQVAALQAAVPNTAFAVQERLEQEIARMNQQAEQLESKRSKLKTDLATTQEFAETVTAWCEGVGGVLKNLEDAAQLRYAVYLDTVPRTVVIETSGFEWK